MILLIILNSFNYGWSFGLIIDNIIIIIINFVIIIWINKYIFLNYYFIYYSTSFELIFIKNIYYILLLSVTKVNFNINLFF